MSKYKVLKMSKEGLEDAIKGLNGILPCMQNVVRMCNGMDKKQADSDTKQMEEHFNTAINAMTGSAFLPKYCCSICKIDSASYMFSTF